MNPLPLSPLPADARCVGCDYLLRGLSQNRCPECGREFDPGNPKTFVVGPRLGWLGKQLLAGVRWPTLGLCGVGVVLLAWASGARFPGGPAGVVVLIVMAVLLGTVFSAMSNAVGMLVRQRETIIGLNTLLLLPLTFVSTTFMNEDLMPHWMRALTDYNPVNWAVVAAREALAERPDRGDVWLPAVGLLLLAVLMVWLSTRTFRTYQKAV